jgi:hypothetical protein
MDVLITLTTAGADTGPFNLYSNVDSYTTAFETGVAKSALVAGYLSTLVPASTNYIRVKSTGRCTNYIDIFVTGSATTTTTTTSGGGPTTTTTTTAGGGPTTTTTTTAGGPTTTTTTTTGSPTTTTTTTASPTTTTTTTNVFVSCEEWRNDTLEEATVTYTPCNTVTPVSNYALATTSSICAVFGSITVTVGGPLTLVGSCNTPAPTTTTTTTAQPLFRVWNLYRSEGAENPACSTTPAAQVIEYNSNYAPGVVFKGSNGLCYTIANDGYQVSPANITLSEEFGTCTECIE